MKNYYNILVNNRKVFSVESQSDIAQLMATVIFYLGNNAKIKWRTEIDAPVIMRLQGVKKHKGEKFIEFLSPFFDVAKSTEYVLPQKAKNQFFHFITHDKEIKILKSPWNAALTRSICSFIPKFTKFMFKQKLNEAEQIYLEQKIKAGEYIDFVNVVKEEREKVIGALLKKHEQLVNNQQTSISNIKKEM